MSTVLRIALTYFEMVPLQRWLNLTGLLLLALGAVLGVFADNVDEAKSVFMACLFGVMCIVICPAFGGAIAMRATSRPSVVHLRPHGRLKVLLGTTLAIALIVVGLAIPTIAANLAMVLNGLQPANRFGEPAAVFVVLGSLIMVGWIILFALSRTMLVALAFPLVVMGGMKVSFLLQTHPRLIAILLVTVGPVAWLLFSLWYLRAGRIKPPQFTPDSTSTSGADYATRWLFDRERPNAPATPSAATMHYLLGVGSYRVFLLTGLWVALLFLAMQLVIPSKAQQNNGLLMSMLPFLVFNSAIMGYTTARRARLLWLRAATDRAGLFAAAEKLGLIASLATWCVVGAAVVGYSLLTSPERGSWIFLYVASQAAAAICMFYGGFALVRDWSARDKAITVGLVLLFILQISVLGPSQAGNMAIPWTSLLVIASLLALALRWYAQRQWRAIDWQLIRPANLDWRRKT